MNTRPIPAFEIPTFARNLHLGLTVRHRQLSARWYQRVLGFRFVKEIDSGLPRTVLLHPDSGFIIGLYNHPKASNDPFDPTRTGLDHFALSVTDQSQLQAWDNWLSRLEIDHSPIRDLGYARFISVEDPDGIQIELWLTLIPHRPADTVG